MHRRRGQASFTLIELLVVIAIIAVLAVLALPTLLKSIAGSRDAQCKRNLHHLQVAAMNYALDNGQALPRVDSYEWREDKPPNESWPWYDAPGWVDWVNWQPHTGTASEPAPGDGPPYWGPAAYTSIVEGSLWEYTGQSFRAYACPTLARSDIMGVVSPDGNDSGKAYDIWRTYVIVPGTANPPTGRGHSWSLGSYDASRTILFTEMAHRRTLDDGTQIASWGMLDNDNIAWDGVLQWWDGNVDNYPDESIGFHHDGRANAVFVDGHVESLLAFDTVDGFAWTNACMGEW